MSDQKKKKKKPGFLREAFIYLFWESLLFSTSFNKEMASTGPLLQHWFLEKHILALVPE